MILGMRAPARGEEGSAMYFVPGGRIGFQRPAAIKPWSSSWHLLSPDHTLQVEVAEALRIDAAWDARMWDQDARHALVASGMLSPAIEYRRFRDQRYGNSIDDGADTCVLRDAQWIGQIRVSTSNLGSPVPAGPQGQIGRWHSAVAAILSSIAVRAPPSVSQGLAEHRLSAALEGLNPRLVGDQLVLSLVPPRTPREAAGIIGSHISAPKLSALPLGTAQQREAATNAAFGSYRDLPGSRVISGAHSRGVLRKENRLAASGDQELATTLMAFGRTRQLALTAFYNDAAREPMVHALEQVLASLWLLDD